MSFDQKKNGNMENDELNIKSHLNTSLDLEGISVSEDLINRTLDAIRKQSQEAADPVKIEQDQKPERNVIPWFKYARNIAVVAAAGLVLVLGMNNIGQMGSKKDEAGTSKEKGNGITYDMAATEQAAPESANSAADAGSYVMEFAAKSAENVPDSNTGDGLKYGVDEEKKADNSIMVKEDTGTEFTTSEASSDDVEGDSLLLSFREICPILPEDAEEITITGRSDRGERVISDPEEMKKFYLLMESYAYAAAESTESKVHYNITIRKTGGIFNMQIAEGALVASYSDGNALIENRYQITGDQQLLQDLEVWTSSN